MTIGRTRLSVEILALFQSFLAHHTTMALTTRGEDGHPQSAPLFYAETEALDLIFISEKKSAHCKNIGRDPRVAGSIYADGQDWRTIQGVQFEGVCSQLVGPAAREAKNTYTARHPFILEDKILRLALSKITWYQVSPTWMRLIDNPRGFGTKFEVHFPPD